jgi:spore coat polysaccharide biosynthesis protein SpsF
MAKVVACIIARTASQRLPLKVLRSLSPELSMIDFLVRRICQVEEIDVVYLCTSTDAGDDILEDVAARNGIRIYRGSPDRVIERMIAVGDLEEADIVLRITGDNPFTSYEYIGRQIAFLEEYALDYVRVADVPVGASAEVISMPALKECYSRMDPDVSEYLMLFLFEPEQFRCGVVKVFPEDFSAYSVTVDTPDDLQRSRRTLEFLGREDPVKIRLSEILDIYTTHEHALPALKIPVSGSVKLPYNEVKPFGEFQEDMHRRKEHSILLKLYE